MLFLVALLPLLPVAAQEASNQPVAEKPERTFQVIKRREVVVGDHTITFQLVAPPAPSAPVPAPAARVLSPQELEAQQRREAKQHLLLFFSATVFDHRVTELRWSDEQGSHRAFSNIDFQYFKGLTEIETADAIYTIMMAFDAESAEALAERTRDFPQLALLPNDRSAWLLAEGSAVQGSPVINAWDALHLHFDANREAMLRGYEEREAAKAEKERIARENPPAPKKNRVISFWKKNSTPIPTVNGNQP